MLKSNYQTDLMIPTENLFVKRYVDATTRLPEYEITIPLEYPFFMYILINGNTGDIIADTTGNYTRVIIYFLNKFSPAIPDRLNYKFMPAAPTTYLAIVKASPDYYLKLNTSIAISLPPLGGGACGGPLGFG